MNYDYSQYLNRIAFSGTPDVSLETLQGLHLAHPTALPFENLSTVLGEPVPLDLESLHDKLIVRGRGGYCFEQNTLLKAVLESIGFELTPLAARVVWGQEPGRENPRTHMVLMVHLGGRDYVADVGFGGATLTAPLLFEMDIEQSTPHEKFRFVRQGSEYEQQVSMGGEWRATYRFDLQPQRPADYEALNHYVATYPKSSFLTFLMAGRPHEHGRYALGGNEFTDYRDGRVAERYAVADAASLRTLLSDRFRIRLPDSHALESALIRATHPDS